MMRFTKFSTLCLLVPALTSVMAATVLLVAPAPAFADPAPSKSETQALYNKLGAAIKKKDTKAIEALATPKAINVASTGQTLTRDAWLKSLGAQLKTFTTVNTAAFTVSSVKMAGGNMVAAASLHLVATLAGNDGKPHTIDATNQEQDTWTKVNGKWLLLIQKDLPGGKLLLDGTSLTPAAPKQ